MDFTRDGKEIELKTIHWKRKFDAHRGYSLFGTIVWDENKQRPVATGEPTTPAARAAVPGVVGWETAGTCAVGAGDWVDTLCATTLAA